MRKQSKYIAGTSLGLMSVGFIATLPFTQGNLMHIVQDGFEAGLVGGLADWFAVTALFRHPLGIPIPHTALLPKNREKVTESLIAVIEQELLNKESILLKLKQIPISESLFGFAEKQLAEPTVQKAIISFAVQAISNFETSRLVPFAQKEIQAFISQMDLSPLINKVIEEVVNNGLDEKAFDFIIDKAEFWAAQEETRDGIGRMALAALERLELNGLMKFALNAFVGYLSEEKLGGMIQTVILSTLEELRDPYDPRRNKIMQIIRGELGRLRSNTQLRHELEAWKQKWINQWDVETSLNQLFSALQQKAIVFISDEAFAEQYMRPFFSNMLLKIQSDTARIEQFEAWIDTQLAKLLETHHLQIGKLVRDNLDKLDNKKLTEMLEEKIGQDLQWIRVNGAVCGFLIGLVLGIIKLTV
ncbi:MAG: hypothetical protein JWM44_2154 [Bacilli bacterium]|nr:hypothetical protein [Bacilli bacterium]